MSVFVFAPILYKGTRELIEALDAKRLVNFDGMHFRHKGKLIEFDKNDTIISWGRCLPKLENVNVINNSCEFITPTIASAYKQWTNKFYNILRNSGIHLLFPTYSNIEIGDAAGYWKTSDFPGYATSFVAFGEEYDFHFAGKTLLRVGTKRNVRPIATSIDVFNKAPELWAHPSIKSNANGWERVYAPKTTAKEFLSVAIEVRDALNIDFCSIHIAYSKPRTLSLFRKVELPTDLDPEGVKLYAEAIKRML